MFERCDKSGTKVNERVEDVRTCDNKEPNRVDTNIKPQVLINGPTPHNRHHPPPPIILIANLIQHPWRRFPSQLHPHFTHNQPVLD